MQTANLELRLSKTGNTIPKRNVTPIEYSILQYEHGGNAGGPIIVEGSFEMLGPKQVVKTRKVKLDDKGKVKTDAVGKPEFDIEARDITPLEELALLKRKYKPATIAKLYPGSNPTNLPTEFSAVGVDDKGVERAAQEAANVEVISAEGLVEIIPLPIAGPTVAPATDGVSVARETVAPPDRDGPAVQSRPGAPTTLTVATGPTVDDGGRPV
jgi:hypothetical protein